MEWDRQWQVLDLVARSKCSVVNFCLLEPGAKELISAL